VLIHVWTEGSQPLAGTAAIEGSEPLHFDGWLELLRVVSELMAAATPDGHAKPGQGRVAVPSRTASELTGQSRKGRTIANRARAAAVRGFTLTP
jgi:hypothetical protein